MRSVDITRVAHTARSTAIIVCMRLRLAGLVVVAVPLGFAPSALAVAPTPTTGSWQAPAVLSSPGQEGNSPAVAIDSQGDAATAWLNRYGFNWDVEASTRAASGEWQQPTVISTPGDIGFHPEVAMDAHGDAVAVWRDGETDQVEAATHRTGGEWQIPVAISAPGDNEKSTVALNSNGEAVVVWERQEGNHYFIQAAYGSAETGVWGEPVDLSASGQAAGNPQVVVDSYGEATVVWQSYGEGDYYIQSATGSVARGTWSEPVDLSIAGQVAANPQVAVNHAGEAVAVWEWGGIELTPYTVQGAVRSADGRWGTPVELSAGGVDDADLPSVAVDEQGDAVAVWEVGGHGSSGGTVQSAVWTAATEVWQSPADLSAPGGNAGSPQVAADPQGAVIVVWPGGGIQGVVGSSGAQWGAPLSISPGGSATAAIDEDGDVVAAWNGTTGAIQSASYIAQPEPPAGETPVSPASGESDRSVGNGSKASAAPDLASANTSGVPGGKEAKAPITVKLRPASARSQCATVASRRTGRKGLAASHIRYRGTNGCVARVRTVRRGRRLTRAGT